MSETYFQMRQEKNITYESIEVLREKARALTVANSRLKGVCWYSWHFFFFNFFVHLNTHRNKNLVTGTYS